MALEHKIDRFLVLVRQWWIESSLTDASNSAASGAAYLFCHPAVANNGEDFNPHLAAAAAMRLSAVTISEDWSWRAVAM